MAEALDEVNKLPICVEPRLLKSCIKYIGVKHEPRIALWLQQFVTLSCQKFSQKTSAEVPKHVMNILLRMCK